jgi:hypothetical protein
MSKHHDDTQPVPPPAPPPSSTSSTPSQAFERNAVHRGYVREIADIERVLDGTDTNTNRMPLTPETRKQLEHQIATLRSRDAELAKRFSRADIVESDPYGRTREEIDAETSRLR